MGFYFKVAPGVKIRATRRGVRASVGPRAARLHLGAGRPGISTGAGPVSLYHSVGGGRGGRGTDPSRTSIAAHERQLRQAEKLEQAQELLTALNSIINLHREEFTLATAPIVPAPKPVNYSEILHRHEQEALRGVKFFHRSARVSARAEAGKAATLEAEVESAKQRQEHAELQRQLDEQWHRLLANDPDTVFATLTEAFEDNEAPAAVAGVDHGEVSVVVMVPDLDVIPERMPEITDAGNVSLRKMTKSMRNSFYLLLVCGHVLVTVRETLAVAPGIRSVRVVVVRGTPPNAYGMRGIECLLAAVFTRDALERIQWDVAHAAMIVNDASTELCIWQGAADELRPLDLSDEPALTELLQAVDLEELGGVVEQHDVGQPSEAPLPWQPRPGWGTVRDYVAVTNDDGGTDVRCRFVPDDGSDPVVLSFQDAALMPELGEYARGIMSSDDELTIKVSAATMIDVEQNAFKRINDLGTAERAVMYAQSGDLHEDCGWEWTSDYKLVKAAPGLIEDPGQVSKTPSPWRPRPGWGTVRDYVAVTHDHGGTDVMCRFVPDDGSEPVQIFSNDATLVPELGEYARGILGGDQELTIKVSAAAMIDVEQNIFKGINDLGIADRALMYAQSGDFHEDCGWEWTPDYKLRKAALGLID